MKAFLKKHREKKNGKEMILIDIAHDIRN